MIGVALVQVAYPGEEPYLHWHTWESLGWFCASVELADWKVRVEKVQNCVLVVKKWTLKKRFDVGL